MEIAIAKDLACEIAGLLTVMHNNLCPAELEETIKQKAEAKIAQLAQLVPFETDEEKLAEVEASFETEADDIIDDMLDNAESEDIERDEAEAESEVEIEPVAEDVPEPEIEEVQEIEAVTEAEELPEVEEETEVEPYIGDEPEVEEEPEVDEEPVVAEVSTDEVSATDLNESVFMRTKVDSISKAFTINDKFRFKRELFGNSDPEFSNALDLISVMRSIDEAEEYFYSELGWDAENEDVKDFMRIVRIYFLNRQ